LAQAAWMHLPVALRLAMLAVRAPRARS